MSISTFITLSRRQWRQLAGSMKSPLNQDELDRLRSLNDPFSLTEAEEIYVPLSRLISLYAESAFSLSDKLAAFLDPGLGIHPERTPFVIGIAGSVAVGKSTIARLLRLLLERWPSSPRVELVTTDGYLYPNSFLEKSGLMDKKGFPESYDRKGLMRFLTRVKSGARAVELRQYSHLFYDVLEETRLIQRPDILIIEGLNLLQPPLAGSIAVSDLIDFGIFLHAKTEDIENWYVERFRQLQKEAFSRPESFFHHLAYLNEVESLEFARGVWNRVNLPNLKNNILPTRPRARLILQKGSDHRVHEIHLRKL